MKDNECKKYIVVSALSSFVIPVSLAVASWGVEPVVGYFGALMMLPLIFSFQLLAYWWLGGEQYKRERPSLKFGYLVGAVLAMPLSITVGIVALNTGAALWEVPIVFLYIFIPLWVSFTMGMVTQYYLIKRNA